jgi:M3 family oligoendopeptidase
MIERAKEMFDDMEGGLGEFFRGMVESGLMDLKTRDGKAGGGFCTSFPSEGQPYIFANFNGTKGDVDVFTHEMGHAYQNYQSRNLPLHDYGWPTADACEVHSMGLEYLTFPQMGRFFGDDADRYRGLHLAQAILFLPYGCAIDHFQHLVYDSPGASAAERHAMWLEVEKMYLPWRDHGDLPHVGKGGFWQIQRHIYLCPFYYIDYTLALTCALQIWAKSTTDRASAVETYEGLCRRGGEAPFQALVRSAGLTSPFDPGALGGAVAQVKSFLDL